MNHATCSTCAAPIMWGRTSLGRSIPLDVEPDPAGNIRLLADPDIEVLGGVSLGEARESGETLYMPHFKSCPDADHHRKERTT